MQARYLLYTSLVTCNRGDGQGTICFLPSDMLVGRAYHPISSWNIILNLHQTLYLSPTMAIPMITFTKLSVLCFYYRIFAASFFRKCVTLVAITCILWGVACFIMVVLKCIPIEASWNIFKNGTCYNFALFIIIAESVNALQDVVIVGMPIGVIHRLQLSVRQRIGLSLIFLFGGL